MSERGWFWCSYFVLVACALLWLAGCAAGWTPAEEERFDCRARAEDICGRDGGSGPCRVRAYKQCAAIKRRAAGQCR